MSDLGECPVADLAQCHQSIQRFTGPLRLLGGERVDLRRCPRFEQPDFMTPRHQVAILLEMLDWVPARVPVYRGITELKAEPTLTKSKSSPIARKFTHITCQTLLSS